MTDHYRVYTDYKNKIDDVLSNAALNEAPSSLYDPIRYILQNGGKRIRPVLVMFSCEVFGGNADDALNTAVAMELLHNFTLVHDDIMDNADTRRGLETIHKRWNSNVAILAGDLLIGLAYSYLLKTGCVNLAAIVKAFTEGVTEVCEGQGYDKEFEERKTVTIPEYIEMIRKKTAKMLETSAATGALCGGANGEQVSNIREYAANIGLAFQIQDDLLDINADETEFGKKTGGDLIEGKKTFLLLKALENVTGKDDMDKIEKIVNENGLKPGTQEQISEVKNIYHKYGVIESAQKEIENYTKLAGKYLDTLPDGVHKERLRWFSEMLMGRSF